MEMRQITQRIKDAFDAGKSLQISNTRTDGQSVWLHGNEIVRREGNKVLATLAGWNTPTTRERVNGVTGAGFHQVNFEAFLNGKPVSDREWIVIK